ncbi:putative reverse transcriptase domain, ribonuclease H-like domain protein [Tanacetum coccineum]
MSTPVLRLATKGISNSWSVHTRVRTKVRHEVHVRTEVHRFVDKEEVRTRAVDAEENKYPYLNFLHNGNGSENVPIGGVDHQSMKGVSQCMNVDHVDKGLRKSILSGPYVPSTVLVQAVAASEGNPAIQQHTTIETVLNMTPENKEHFLSEKEAIFLLLTGIGDEIYSTVDACKTANEMWIAIERLQQGESLNVQDVKTNLFWEFGKFTSRDGESMESYYSRFYKLMNELTRNNLQVTTMQVNVQFLQQLQPEWSRFVTVVKQSKEIDTISYHTLFDILKQQSSSTRHKGKEIVKPVTPPSESVSEEDSDPEQAQKEKDMQKNLALLAKYFKRLYKPTNNNLRTSSNSRNKTEDTTPSLVVQQTGIQCFNCKGFGHYAKECRKPKRVKDYMYHKEKMMMCKQAEQGVPLQAEQADWLADTDEEIDEQELQAH